MRFALKVLGALLALLILGPLLIGLGLKALATQVPPPGQFVDVGGHRLHIVCSGKLQDSPPVLIEAGLGVSSSYYHWIQTNLARTTKVCTYDRAGLGWSEESGRPRELGDVVEQLHTLLDKAGFERPYVLAGHSIGALILRDYVARYRDEVAGLAFLDGSHPEQTRRLGLENFDQKAAAEQGLAMYRLMVRLGLSRLYDPALAPVKTEFPEHILAELQYTTGESYFGAVRAEYEGLAPLTNLPRPNDSFGDKPTMVIQAGEKWDPALFPPSVDAAKVSAVWPVLQQETAALSTRSRYSVVKDASHMSVIYHQAFADQAAELIRGMLVESRTAM